MPLLCLPGVSEAQSVAARATPAQRHAGEGGFRVGMTAAELRHVSTTGSNLILT